jgi:MFS family permease
LVHTVRAFLAQTLGGLPRQFWYLFANALINRIGSFTIIVLALYLTGVRGLSVTFAGLVVGLWGAGAAVGTLAGGVLADQWGRRNTALVALYGSAVIVATLGVLRDEAAIAVAVFALGLVGEASRPALTALMIDIVPEPDRVRAFSLNYWVINVGFAVAALTAGLVAGVDYLLIFLLNAATTAAGATLIALWVREPDRISRPAQPVAIERPGLGQVFTDRVFLGFLAANLLTALVFMQHISTLPITMGRDGLSAATFGQVIAVNGVLIVVGQLFVPRLLRGRDHANVLALAAVITGVGFGLTAFAHTAWWYAMTVLIWTAGEMLSSPAGSTTNAELSPVHMRGRYQGAFSLSWSVASFAAPILGAAMLEFAGRTALWLGCLGMGLVVAAIHRSAGPARRRRAAQLWTGSSPGMDEHRSGHSEPLAVARG